MWLRKRDKSFVMTVLVGVLLFEFLALYMFVAAEEPKKITWPRTTYKTGDPVPEYLEITYRVWVGTDKNNLVKVYETTQLEVTWDEIGLEVGEYVSVSALPTGAEGLESDKTEPLLIIKLAPPKIRFMFRLTPPIE